MGWVIFLVSIVWVLVVVVVVVVVNMDGFMIFLWDLWLFNKFFLGEIVKLLIFFFYFGRDLSVYDIYICKDIKRLRVLNI